MMNKISQGPIFILSLTVDALLKNPVILYPVFILAFIQLFTLEIIYFTPRYPLSLIFGPIIIKAVNPMYMHYPYNYILMMKWYHAIEIFMYIFINCIFYAAIVRIIALINGGEAVDLKKVYKQVFDSYPHVMTAMVLPAALLQALSLSYKLLLDRVVLIRSSAGVYYMIKQSIIAAGPYFHLIFASIAVSVFAFVVPVIMIEQKNLINAVKISFLRYRGSFGLIFLVCLIPSFLYVPFLLFRVYLGDNWTLIAPERSCLFLVLSILTMLLIDVLQLTAITLCYLFRKEEQ
jgi:hypothetical protein